MSNFENIRFFNDNEVQQKLQSMVQHPMFKSLMHYTFPHIPENEYSNFLKDVQSIQQFHEKVICQTMYKVIDTTSEGLTVSGIEHLDNHTSYLFISNHRDILLDTSLLNVSLLRHHKIMTASAIGNNLVPKTFLLDLAKLNRNFIVKRDAAPRELLANSKLMSQYIWHLLYEENRSVWIAQREGRTKDGNDATHSGVIKMLAMANTNMPLLTYLKSLRIVPVAISYEYDPTDKLKMPQLMAQSQDLDYIKEKNEDFINLMSGVIGQKKRIHIHICDALNEEFDAIGKEEDNEKQQLQTVAKCIDQHIINHYKLWPTNYIAYDLRYQCNTYEAEYSLKEKQLFLRRLEMRVDKNNLLMVEKFLDMYANPVVNKFHK